MCGRLARVFRRSDFFLFFQRSVYIGVLSFFLFVSNAPFKRAFVDSAMFSLGKKSVKVFRVLMINFGTFFLSFVFHRIDRRREIPALSSAGRSFFFGTEKITVVREEGRIAMDCRNDSLCSFM